MCLDFSACASLSDCRWFVRRGRVRHRQSKQADRVGHLFALATARLEDAHAIAIAGQNPRLTPAERRNLQRRLLHAIERCRLAAERIATADD